MVMIRGWNTTHTAFGAFTWVSCPCPRPLEGARPLFSTLVFGRVSTLIRSAFTQTHTWGISICFSFL